MHHYVSGLPNRGDQLRAYVETIALPLHHRIQSLVLARGLPQRADRALGRSVRYQAP